MCNIVENNKQLKNLIEDFNSKDNVICLPIFSDRYLHHLNKNNKLSLLYFNDFKDVYIVPFNNHECNNLLLDSLDELKNISTNIFTLNKKILLNLLDTNNIFDVNLMNYYLYGNTIDTENIRINTIDVLHNKYYKMNNINSVIPLYKHLEWCDIVTDKMMNTIQNFKQLDKKDIDSYKNYNNEVINVFYNIEKYGFKVNSDKLMDAFDIRINKHVNDDKLFSEYNLYTSTGRPSNSFGGVNFSALKKDSLERECFVTSKDALIEYDYDAYHLRLIAHLIDYKFGDESVHEHLAKFYGVSYEESKQITFRQLYGGVDKEIAKQVPFFDKVKYFIDDLWNIFKTNKYLKTYIYSRRLLSEGLDKNRLFNYYIQSFETEYNIKKIIEIQNKLKNYETELILYGYDSFVVDFDKQDGKELLGDIRSILEGDGFLTKIKSGKNYRQMLDITGKIC